MVCDKKCVQKQSKLEKNWKSFLEQCAAYLFVYFLMRMSFFKSFYRNLIVRVDSKSTFIHMSLIIEYWRA